MSKELDLAKIQELHSQACAQGLDFYVDPQSGLMVTTEVAHKKRGHCCKSGCRHCPYGFQKQTNKS